MLKALPNRQTNCPDIPNGTKIKITDEKLPHFNREFFVLFRQKDCLIYSYGIEKNQSVANGYAGKTQFIVIQ